MTSTGELLDRPSAVRLQPAYADTTEVLRVIRAVDPFWAIVRYAASDTETKALSNDGRSSMFVPPWLRRDFALHGEALVPDAGLVLGNPRFVAPPTTCSAPTSSSPHHRLRERDGARPGAVRAPHRRAHVPGGHPRRPPALAARPDAPAACSRTTASSWPDRGVVGSTKVPAASSTTGPRAPTAPAASSARRTTTSRSSPTTSAPTTASPRWRRRPAHRGPRLDTMLHRVDGGLGGAGGRRGPCTTPTTPTSASPCRGRARSTPTRPIGGGWRTTRDDLDLDQVVDTLVADIRAHGVDVGGPPIRTTTRPGSPPSRHLRHSPARVA